MPTLCVSVLMTAFNREKYIAQAIESVLASTFQDFELIVVDDCSTDNTFEIACRYQSDPRVRVVRNEQNLGDYSNRNRVASLAQGMYLKYLDSDDVIYPHGLECMVRSMRQFPEAAVGLGRPPSERGPFPIEVSPLDTYREHFLGPGMLVMSPGSAIIRADAFRSVGGFSGRRFVGDEELWLRLAARYPVVKFPRYLIWWRPHANQETKIRETRNLVAAATHLQYQVHMEALTDPACPLPPDERAAAVRRVGRRHARSILRLAWKNLQFRSALQLYRQSSLSVSDFVGAIYF